jgi:hypothetical protein
LFFREGLTDVNPFAYLGEFPQVNWWPSRLDAFGDQGYLGMLATVFVAAV